MLFKQLGISLSHQRTLIWLHEKEEITNMQMPYHHSGISLVELKSQIVKKLGPERSKQYFFYLNKFLCLKVRKLEFNKICFRILGLDNIQLHNQLIRSILKNACCGKGPISKNLSGDGYRQRVFQNNVIASSLWLTRTVNHDWRSGDRRNTPENASSEQPTSVRVFSENEYMNPPDVGRILQHNQVSMQQSENEIEILGSHSADMPVMKRSVDGSSPSCSKDRSEFLVKNDEKEASERTHLWAPLGIPFCNFRAPKTSYRIGDSRFVDGVLWDTLTMKEQLEQMVIANGLERMSLDSANILNHALDSYLKGLIKPCIELLGSRSDQRTQSAISIQDFRVAIELNPQKLGEYWPLLLEKMYTEIHKE